MFTLLSIITVVLQFVNFWYLSKKKVVYPLIFAIYLGYMIIETWLALRDPTQWAIMLFNLVNVWAIAMTTKGMLAARKNKIS